MRITVVTPEPAADAMASGGGEELAALLRQAMEDHGIELVPNYSVRRISERQVWMNAEVDLSYNLLMLVPPFSGAPALPHQGLTDSQGFTHVDRSMRLRDVESAYAVGDCVNFSGPKMGHMAVRQAEVAAANMQAELEGRKPTARYSHEARFVIDTGDEDSIYLHQQLWSSAPGITRQGRFWSWAKRTRERCWEHQHS